MFHEARIEAERSGAALMGDGSIAPDHVKAIRPPGIGALGRVLEVIHQGGELDTEIPDARAANLGAFTVTLRAGENHIVPNVHRQLPGVIGVGLLDVDQVEGRLGAVFAVDAVKLGNLPAKWRSSVAAEDEYNRTAATHLGEPHTLAVIRGFELEIGRGVTGIQTAGTSPHP